CVIPVATVTAFGDSTLLVVAPVPSSPRVLTPQQLAAPPPHAHAKPLSVVTPSAVVSPVFTFLATIDGSDPQHQTSPEITAQALPIATARLVAVPASGTATGVAEIARDSRPSAPSTLLPQQVSAPLATAQR